MTDLPAHAEPAVEDRQASIGDIAREEFWIVAKSYFALIYGTVYFLKRLIRIAMRVDDRARTAGKARGWSIPAE